MVNSKRKRREPERSVCEFSPCEIYRYTLEHRWDDDTPAYARNTIAWLLLNPSTADTSSLDPTLRRCRGFSRAFGGGGMIILNLYAFRATLPRDMLDAADPVGPFNDYHIERTLRRDDIKMAIAGWGTHGGHLNRAANVLQAWPGRFHALAVNKDGSPSHPLYLKSTLVPQPYPPLLTP